MLYMHGICDSGVLGDERRLGYPCIYRDMGESRNGKKPKIGKVIQLLQIRGVDRRNPSILCRMQES